MFSGGLLFTGGCGRKIIVYDFTVSKYYYYCYFETENWSLINCGYLLLLIWFYLNFQTGNQKSGLDVDSNIMSLKINEEFIVATCFSGLILVYNNKVSIFN